MIGPLRLSPSPAPFPPASIRLVRALLFPLLLLGGTGPVGAQRGLPGMRLPSFLGGLRVSTGVLTAPGDHYRRTALPVVLGLGLERTDRAGRRWSLEFSYSGWSESVPYRDQVASYVAYEQVEILGLLPIGVRTFDLGIGLLWPIGRTEAPYLLAGAGLGWRRHVERWTVAETSSPSTLPVPPERDQLTLDVRLVVPLSAGGTGRELTLGYRTTLASFVVKGREPLTSADGLRAVLSMPFGPSRMTGRRIPRGAAFEPVAERVPFQLGIFYGLPGIGPEVEALDWGSLIGLDLLVPLAGSWDLLTEVATFFWRIDSSFIGEHPEAAISLPPDSPTPQEWANRPFFPEGRAWEVKIGGLSPIVTPAGIPLRAGGLLGVRRQQEWWSFFYAYRDLYGSVQELPPPDPGAEVRAVADLRLVLLLGRRPQIPQLHLSRVWDLGLLWPERRRTAVSPDGWRLSFVLPLGRF